MKVKDIWGFILLVIGIVGGVLLVYNAPTGQTNEDVKFARKVLVKYQNTEGDQKDFAGKVSQMDADKEVLHKKKKELLGMIKRAKKDSLKYQSISQLSERQKIRKAFNSLSGSERRSILGTKYGSKEDIYTILNLNSIPTFAARFGGD